MFNSYVKLPEGKFPDLQKTHPGRLWTLRDFALQHSNWDSFTDKGKLRVRVTQPQTPWSALRNCSYPPVSSNMAMGNPWKTPSRMVPPSYKLVYKPH